MIIVLLLHQRDVIGHWRDVERRAGDGGVVRAYKIHQQHNHPLKTYDDELQRVVKANLPRVILEQFNISLLKVAVAALTRRQSRSEGGEGAGRGIINEGS